MSAYLSVPAAVEPSHPICAALFDAAHRRSSGWAVRDRTCSLTYSELRDRALLQAEQFDRSGISTGDLVMVESTHDVAYLVTYFAALLLGANVAPYDPSGGPAERLREAEQYNMQFRIIPSLESAHCERLDSADAAPSRQSALVDGGLVLLPTSGTGGLPKRAMHSQAGLIGNAAAHAASVSLGEGDTTLIILSPAFGFCHTSQILAHVLVGGRIVFPRKPVMPVDLAMAMREARATNTTLVPHLLTDTLTRALSGVPSLRQISLGGSPMTPEFIDRIAVELPGVEVIQTWGMTECGPRLTTWRPDRDPLTPGCVGRPIAGVHIEARPFGKPQGSSGELELYARTPYAMLGYLPGPGTDSDVLVEPDLVRTGDLGHVDADGQVHVVGRLKNLIDVAGKKVAAEEIEAVIARISGVSRVRVVGRDDPLRGTRPVALVVRGGGAPTEEQVHGAVRAELAPHKWLREVVFVDALETTTTGKTRRSRYA